MSAPILTGPGPVVQIPEGDPGVEYRGIIEFPGYAVGNDGTPWTQWLVLYNESGRGGARKIRTQAWQRAATWSAQGYRRLGLDTGTKKGEYYVHTLVLTAFIGTCPPGMEACHDPDRTRNNCRLDNLRWGTRLENRQDCIRHGMQARGERQGHHKLTEAEVRMIMKRLLAGEKQYDLADEYGVKQPAISNIKHYKTWAHLWLKQPGPAGRHP